MLSKRQNLIDFTVNKTLKSRHKVDYKREKQPPTSTHTLMHNSHKKVQVVKAKASLRTTTGIVQVVKPKASLRTTTGIVQVVQPKASLRTTTGIVQVVKPKASLRTTTGIVQVVKPKASLRTTTGIVRTCKVKNVVTTAKTVNLYYYARALLKTIAKHATSVYRS